MTNSTVSLVEHVSVDYKWMKKKKKTVYEAANLQVNAANIRFMRAAWLGPGRWLFVLTTSG